MDSELTPIARDLKKIWGTHLSSHVCGEGRVSGKARVGAWAQTGVLTDVSLGEKQTCQTLWTGGDWASWSRTLTAVSRELVPCVLTFLKGSEVL